ncbi:hypothetical protein EXIGLDRAFT_840401 [Exidia glandulosa HHB12029]|uniref:Cupredoxin n=1 Tax=Exidia glandulosa HHB12029 TaxID=1314781 RepID=A0A165EGV9_EXIGL|nr:hypothetical protein EXIGLDRAFT_840401 [Exidia glandulosa HHB12029]
MSLAVTIVFLAFVLVCLADAQNVQTITAGYSKGSDSPLNVTAAVGDVLYFSIIDTGKHTFSQTSLDHPCVALAGGFSTGVDPRDNVDFGVKLLEGNATVYYACMHHCHDGEVGTVNAALDPTAPGSFDAFVLAAKGSNVTDFTPAANVSTPGTYANGTLFVLSDADIKSIIESYEHLTVPSWAFGLIFVGIVAIMMGSLYLLARYWLRSIRAKAQAKADDEERSWELESVSSKTLVEGQPRAPVRRADPFEGFPI